MRNNENYHDSSQSCYFSMTEYAALENVYLKATILLHTKWSLYFLGSKLHGEKCSLWFSKELDLLEIAPFCKVGVIHRSQNTFGPMWIELTKSRKIYLRMNQGGNG